MQKRRIRILHCSSSLAFGGQGTLLQNTIRFLDPNRYENVVCGIRPARDGEVDPSTLGCKVVSLGVREARNIVGAVAGLRRLIINERIDLIHAHIFGTEREVFLASLLTGRPLIGTLTTTFDPRLQALERNRLLTARLWLLQSVTGLLARAAGARFIGLSEWVRRSGIEHLHIPPQRIDIVSVGLVPEDFLAKKESSNGRAGLREELGLGDAYPVLVNVGRLSPAKGQADLLNAMPRILERLPRARLLIVGDGRLRPALESQAARLGIQKAVRFLGWRNDVPSILHSSDVFVFTSYYEGVPNAVVEAMASGLPVVAYHIPALEEVLESGAAGLLVNQRSPESLADAVSRIVSDHVLRETITTRAIRAVHERHDARANVRKLESIYERMLAGNTAWLSRQ